MSFFSSLFGSKRPSVKEGGAKAPLGLVTYVAGLASNQVEIGPILDTVRGITASLAPGEAPSPENDQKLLDVYLQLETYLTTKEPIRTFTKEELRKRIAEPLLSQLTSHEVSKRASPNIKA